MVSAATIPFTGDVNFSESEVVDRLLEIFGGWNVEMIPGISYHPSQHCQGSRSD